MLGGIEMRCVAAPFVLKFRNGFEPRSRACYGDPGEIMRGLRHRLEAIVVPDWACLADICLELTRSPRKGTRLWAIEQLAILDDPRAKSLFERAIETEPLWIAEAAACGLDNSTVGGN